MCGFKGKAVMSSGSNDTARCAPATAWITAVNWVCNGVLFQAWVWKEPTKSRIQSYLSALLESRERMCSHYCSLLPLHGAIGSGEVFQRVKNTNMQPRVEILTFRFLLFMVLHFSEAKLKRDFDISCSGQHMNYIYYQWFDSVEWTTAEW